MGRFIGIVAEARIDLFVVCTVFNHIRAVWVSTAVVRAELVATHGDGDEGKKEERREREF